MLTLGTLGLVAAHLLSWGAVCHALLHKRDPRSALGWIVTVLFLPGVGIVLYCLFGISRAESLAARLMRKMAAIEPDYAHHPDELHALLTMARQLGYQRLVVAFQPHTYSRTAKLFDRFVEELKLADVAVLAEIYAAREQNTMGISSADLARNIPGSVYCSTLDKVTAQLRELARPGDLILTVGAGDIYRAGEKLLSETED